MKARRLPLLFAALGGLGLLAAACAPAAEPKPAQPEAAKPAEQAKPAEPAKPVLPPGEESAKFGGVLLISQSLAAPGYIPWEEAVTSAMLPVHPQTNQIVQFQTWGDYARQDYWNIVGDLAKSWEQSADGLKWTFKFNSGIQWSDGTPFTCADAKWSLDSIRTGKDLRRSPRAVQFKAVDKVECADELTMVVTLRRPQSAFLEVVAMGPNMVWPKHAYEGKEKLDKMRTEPKHVGTGPFVVKEFVPGEKYVFTRNAAYWKKPYPYLDGVEIPLLAAPAIRTAMRAGRVDMEGTGSAFSGPGADQLLKECQTCQFWPRFNHNGFTALQVNHQRPPWNAQAVRDAIGYAVDQKKLVDVCNAGWGIAGRGIIHPDSPFALPEGLLKGIPGFDLSDPKANKEKAKVALASGGFKPGDLTLKIPVWATIIEPYVPCLVEDLASIGIKLEGVVYETAKMYEIMGAGDFDVVPWGFFLTARDPDVTFYEHFYTGSDRNYGRYANPAVDKLIDQQSATLDSEQRKRLLHQLSETIMKEQGKLVVFWYHYMPITGPKVRNFMGGPTCTSHGPCMRLERVWLEK